MKNEPNEPEESEESEESVDPRRRNGGHPPAQSGKGRRGVMVDVILTLCVVGVYAVIQWNLRRPPSLAGGDQLDYFTAADRLPDVEPTHRHLRIGLLLPVRAALSIFGYSEAAYYAVPFFAGALLAASAFMLGRLLLGRAVGFGSGLLVVANPYVLWESSHLLPDIFATACFSAGLATLLLAVRGYAMSWLSRRQEAWLLMLAGFLLGWSYLVREYIVILFPLAVLVLALYRFTWRRMALVASSSAIALVLEFAWGWWNYGNPLIRLADVIAPGGADTSVRPFATSIEGVVRTLPDQLLAYSVGGAWLTLSVVLLIIPLVARYVKPRYRKGLWLGFCWAGGLWAVFTILGILPTLLWSEERAYIRLQKVRYWFPIFPGLVVGALGTIYAVLGRMTRTRPSLTKLAGSVVLIVAVVIAQLGLRDISNSSVWVNNGNNHYLALRQELADSTGTKLWLSDDAGRASILVAPMYTRTFFGGSLWHGSLRSLTTDDHFVSREAIEGGLLLFEPLSFSYPAALAEALPEYLKAVPEDWGPEYVAANGTLALLNIDQDGDATSERVEGWQVIDLGSPTAVEGRLSTRPEEASLIVARAGERGWVADPKGARLDGPENSGRYLPMEFVRWDIEGSVTGDGGARAFCYFYTEDGRRRRVMAVWTGLRQEPQESSLFCANPWPHDERAAVRLAFDVRGPAALMLDDTYELRIYVQEEARMDGLASEWFRSRESVGR